jgi:hypothetical protein
MKDLFTRLQIGDALFADVIHFIEERYTHTPTAFQNGLQYNSAHENQGSAKVFSFAKLNDLTKEQTLRLFAEHYQAVLNNPEGTDHQNIRQFMIHGWDGITFEGNVLSIKGKI